MSNAAKRSGLVVAAPGSAKADQELLPLLIGVERLRRVVNGPMYDRSHHLCVRLSASQPDRPAAALLAAAAAAADGR